VFNQALYADYFLKDVERRVYAYGVTVSSYAAAAAPSQQQQQQQQQMLVLIIEAWPIVQRVWQ
jgi:hypothetical protein